MIYVSKRQYGEVEYLIQQSIQGNHVLFDHETLKRVFGSRRAGSFLSQEESPEDMYEVEHHIEKLIAQPTLAAKRAYLDSLSRELQDRVVRVYFVIVENNLYQSQEVRH